MISAIIPSYRNPAYLDLCLRSATEGRKDSSTEIIVILDGFANESMPIVEKYENISVIPLQKNYGMQNAINLGVMNATNPFVFVVNDDNVFPSSWDTRIPVDTYDVVTVNQVEAVPSIFNFVTYDLGRTAQSFRYNDWLKYELTIVDDMADHATSDGRVFPFVISKRWFMTVGGFDTFYNSPFWCDVDFWLKLELTNQLKFSRWHGCHLYHFGSIATKNRGDAEAEVFRRSEGDAAQQFIYKWGYLPDIVDAARHRNNSKLPLDKTIKGITFQG